MNNPAVLDSWQRGNPCERYVGRWSRPVAPAFLSWLGIPPGRKWPDADCGRGALCAAIARCDAAVELDPIAASPDEDVVSRLPVRGDSSISLIARAWALRGRVAR